MTQIIPPTTCPSCATVLMWVKDTLYCTNSQCGSQAGKRIEHFAKTLKIKGLGPSTISKLGLTSINDIYNFPSKEALADALRSEKTAFKLWEEIEASKSADLSLLLAGFSIPLIGTTAASKLSETCASIKDISETTCKLAGLGDKATSNLLTWLDCEFPEYADLPFDFKFKSVTNNQNKGTVCISGKLRSFKTKAEAAKALTAAGYKIKDSVTKEVTILINEGGADSAKTEKAKQLGIKIVTNIGELL